jgi:hypothetical protein
LSITIAGFRRSQALNHCVDVNNPKAPGVTRKAEKNWGARKRSDAMTPIDYIGIIVVIVLIVWLLAQG